MKKSKICVKLMTLAYKDCVINTKQKQVRKKKRKKDASPKNFNRRT